jgi:hypothetical protein
MIISASRKTDIPAHYADWFVDSFKQGKFVLHPESHKPRTINVDTTKVDVIVFWTKDPANLMGRLNELEGYNYYFQFTLNDYPKEFEPTLRPFEARLKTFQELSDRIGPSRVIWRYDPIIISDLTPINYHIDRIKYISNQLAGKTERLVISFMDYYRFVLERMGDVKFVNPTDQETNDMCQQIVEVCKPIEVFSCAENITCVNHGACIDTDLINKIFGLSLEYKKDYGQRGACLCTESIDVGTYNTCTHNCKYCYANNQIVETTVSCPTNVGLF